MMILETLRLVIMFWQASFWYIIFLRYLDISCIYIWKALLIGLPLHAGSKKRRDLPKPHERSQSVYQFQLGSILLPPTCPPPPLSGEPALVAVQTYCCTLLRTDISSEKLWTYLEHFTLGSSSRMIHLPRHIWSLEVTVAEWCLAKACQVDIDLAANEAGKTISARSTAFCHNINWLAFQDTSWVCTSFYLSAYRLCLRDLESPGSPCFCQGSWIERNPANKQYSFWKWHFALNMHNTLSFHSKYGYTFKKTIQQDRVQSVQVCAKLLQTSVAEVKESLLPQGSSRVTLMIRPGHYPSSPAAAAALTFLSQGCCLAQARIYRAQNGVILYFVILLFSLIDIGLYVPSGEIR